jgi:hypothetical protein
MNATKPNDLPDPTIYWLIETYLSIHGPDPVPHTTVEVTEDMAQAARTFAATLAKAYPGMSSQSAAKTTTIGLQRTEAGHETTEQRAIGVIKPRCYYYEGSPAICFKQVIVLDH